MRQLSSSSGSADDDDDPPIDPCAEWCLELSSLAATPRLMRTPCLDSLARHGFERVTLGERTLRTDVAVVSLLAIANEHLEPS